MRNLYNIGIRLYGFSIFMAGFFNTKAAKWKSGRKDIFIKLKKVMQGSKQPLAWFHCASLGEFEQGRPLIEAFRNTFPEYKILLTFFSPSGYEVRKDYAVADYIFYLPLDTPFNAKRFIEITKPSVAIFVKYEFWFNYLNELNARKIPTFLVSAKFRAEQYFFKSTGAWFRKSLHFYHTLFVQDKNSETLLKTIGVNNVIVCGDTRFDRVLNISHQPFSDSVTEQFKNGQLLWLCGSTWEEDEKLIFPVFEKIRQSQRGIKLLIAPHDVGEARIKSILGKYPGAVRYLESLKESKALADVMIIDKIGLLSYLYRSADIAYVGGGFGKGIHNLTEAAVYGIPVIFGPNHQKFNEAQELLKRGGGFSISTAEELEKIMLRLLAEPGYRKSAGEAGAVYILSGQGSTGRIITELEKTVRR